MKEGFQGMSINAALRGRRGKFMGINAKEPWTCRCKLGWILGIVRYMDI
jgi:hypothetical protein